MHTLGGCMGVGWRLSCVRRRSASRIRVNWCGRTVAVKIGVRKEGLQGSARGCRTFSQQICDWDPNAPMEDFSCVLILRGTLPTDPRRVIVPQRTFSEQVIKSIHL